MRIKDSTKNEFTNELFKSEEYLKNEYATNKSIACFMFCFVIINIINLLSLNITYSDEAYVAYSVFLPINTILLVLIVVTWLYKFKEPWVKKLLLASVILISLFSFFVFSLYAIYFVFVPIFLATRYFSKRTIYIVSAVTIILFITACILSVALESISSTVMLFHINSNYNPWGDYVDTLLYVVSPSLALLIFLVIFGANLTTRGRKLIIAQTENTRIISAVDAELAMAAKIQKSVLPTPYFKTENGNFSLFAHEVPAKEVCGDFYDYFMINDHLMVIVVADVSDKGVPAAMFMMSAKKVIQCSIESSTNLEDSIKLSNKLICMDNTYGMFLTLWLGVIDINSGVGKYINAGHPYPIIKHGDGSVEQIENEPNLFIGHFPNNNPKVYDFRMKPDDVLFIYTDGLTDTTNLDGEDFGKERLINCIKESKCSSEKLSANVIECAKEFSEGTSQFDDITTLALHCNTINPPRKINKIVTSGTDGTKIINDELQEALKIVSCSDEKRRNIGVIVDEICNNINEYSYKDNGQIEFSADIGSDYVELTFIDSGVPFNPLEHKDPVIGETPQIGGLGIYFVKQLSDKVTYEYKDGKNKLTVLIIWEI